MNIKVLSVGQLSTNCYIVYSDGVGIVIDPGDEGQRIFEFISSLELKITHIVLTHAHFDHIGAVDYLKEKTNAQIALGKFEIDNYKKQPVMFSFAQIPKSQPDILLSDGDEIPVGNSKLKVMHTPGHTTGGITLIGNSFAVCGDTLFCESIGRTDLPGGNYSVELDSVDKILQLPGETLLYCGHGASTTVTHEKKYNMFLKR